MPFANIRPANLRYKLKKRQVKVLKKFAQAMKWPNLNSTMENLRLHDEEFRLDSISSDAFAFFSGLVLPGVCCAPLTSCRRLPPPPPPLPFYPQVQDITKTDLMLRNM